MKPRRWRRRGGVLVACLAAFAGRAAPPGARAVSVETADVVPRRIVYVIETTGELEADALVVSCEVEGVVREVLFEEGDRVTEGQLLATVDPERYALLSQRAQAARARAAAQLAEVESALARRKALREKDPGWVSEEEILQHTASVAVARAALAEAEAAWRLAEEDARRSRIRSPFAGVIERRRVVPGQHVDVGAQVATLVDLTDVRLRFRLAEAEWARLGEDQEVLFDVDAVPGRRFAARLFHVGRQADPATRTVSCVARVPEPDPSLRAGVFARVRIEIDRREQALAVPEAALLPTEKGYLVFVVEGDVARAREVTLGLHTRDGAVEILSGLSPGETIVTRGAKFLWDGAPIRRQEGAPATGRE